MNNTEFLEITSYQVHNTICALLPEVANNFMFAIYILEILFYMCFAVLIFKGINFIVGGRK